MSPYRERRSTWRDFATTSPLFRKLSIWFLNNGRPAYHQVTRSRKRVALFLCLGLAILVLFVVNLPIPGTGGRPISFDDFRSSTLVYEKEDLQKIWYWEIASGHYPSRKLIPGEIGLKKLADNPGLPPKEEHESTQVHKSSSAVTTTNGVGSKRLYLDIQRRKPNAAYPPRPIPGSIIDLDIVDQHCDFYQDKYTRDCLEVLRDGGALTQGQLRRVNMDDWKYIYLETDHVKRMDTRSDADNTLDTAGNTSYYPRGSNREIPPVKLPPPMKYRTYSQLQTPCDPDYPRLFHMFWTGPFTDKPYMAILSFLYTQNTGLHVENYPEDKGACRPQLWLWVNPGPAGAVHHAGAAAAMMDMVRDSPWMAPFLHSRFRDVIKFKVWDTEEELDSIPEIRDEWRSLTSIFKSHGKGVKPGDGTPEDQYDKLSVVLSDMVRFVLCHRYGGIYLDMDMLFLRDWEELWGWKGAFAYSWSAKSRYNTAVLHMNKNSALGTFLLRTALKQGLNFHPITITFYLKDAHSTGLLHTVPDALFDSAWLNVDNYQRNRPPQPFFTNFIDFFETPVTSSAGPLALGFDGFFRGAFAYHYHNFWWKPFDTTRDWPDLGSRFEENERKARNSTQDSDYVDLRDLDWSAVMKRTFESYIRGERPNMYGEWIKW